MTLASHHHPDCKARLLGDDACRCSWRIRPDLPEDERWMLGPTQSAGIDLNYALENLWAAIIQGTRMGRVVAWLSTRLERPR